jgi:ferrous iron transport protein B
MQQPFPNQPETKKAPSLDAFEGADSIAVEPRKALESLVGNTPPHKQVRRIALVGNPNTGKSSLFNALTGLHQKVGNLAGVTVDVFEADLNLPGLSAPITLQDLPGLYSLSPRSADEEIVTRLLLEPTASSEAPEAIVIVADATNLRRSLFLYSQLADTNLPIVLALTMADVATGLGLQTNTTLLATRLGARVVSVNGRSGEGLAELNKELVNLAMGTVPKVAPFLNTPLPVPSETPELTNKAKAKATMARYQLLATLLEGVQKQVTTTRVHVTEQLDRVLLHPIWGYAIFLLVLFAIFQAVFTLAAYPMDALDAGVSWFTQLLSANLPDSWLSRLLVEGIVPGIGGVLVFIPQIFLLSALTGLLEDTGYMARVIFLTDRTMRRFGLSGRSVVPLFSGLACSVPAIMAARTIENRRERLLTILVTPFMSCSARLPVFTVLIALAVPDIYVLGILSLQGLVLLGAYFIGTFFALAAAWLLKQFVRARGNAYLMLELPLFKAPRWQALLMEAYLKCRVFVLDAGKVILAVSLLLWLSASYGPGLAMDRARLKATELAKAQKLPEAEAAALLATAELEASYAGHLGRVIEPAIRPLGYDWKIGIALIASFAAREVFVGTMATIYSVGQAPDQEATLLSRMRTAKDLETGRPVYRPSVAFSLIVFYLLAQQCASTFAIVRRETGSWGWATGQLLGMAILAWVCSFAIYQVMDRL